MFALAPATAASADDAERASIAAERASIEARYAERERECVQRFVVTSCVDEAKRERRLGLDALKARQLALDEARRRARTAERSAELAAKAAEDAKREQAVHAPAASAPRSDGMPRAARLSDSAASMSKTLGSAVPTTGAPPALRLRSQAPPKAPKSARRTRRATALHSRRASATLPSTARRCSTRRRDK